MRILAIARASVGDVLPTGREIGLLLGIHRNSAQWCVNSLRSRRLVEVKKVTRSLRECDDNWKGSASHRLLVVRVGTDDEFNATFPIRKTVPTVRRHYTKDARSIVLAIAKSAYQHRAALPRLETIAKSIGCRIHTVIRHVDALERDGTITLMPLKGNRTRRGVVTAVAP